jgi:acyl dehydratase
MPARGGVSRETRYPERMHIPPPLSHPPLPKLTPSTLLRTLFKQPARACPQPISAGYRLDNIDAGQVRRYNEAFGFAPGSVPLTYLYLLAQRAQLATMLDCAIPFRIPGLIHVANELAMARAVCPDSPLILATTWSMPEPGTNGAVECVMVTRATDGEQTLFTCTSRYLVKRGKRASKGHVSPRVIDEHVPIGEWLVAADAGRRYAALSGDWNPIHLWPWSARLMGMQHPIIHGMHTVAMACSLYQRATGNTASALHCQFRRPVPLGSTVKLAIGPAPDAFSCVCNGRVSVEGTIVSA